MARNLARTLVMLGALLVAESVGGTAPLGVPRSNPLRPRNHGALYTLRIEKWHPPDRSAVYGGHAARAVDRVIARIQAGKLDDELPAVLDALAEHRSAIQGDKTKFGRARAHWLWSSGQGTSGQYERWSQVMPARTVVTLSTGEKIHVTARDSDGDFAHTDPAHIAKIVNECVPLYKKALRPDLPLKDIVETVGQIHWWLTQAAPFRRGSAGIADMLTKSILLRQGIEVSPWAEGISPDLDGFLVPEAKAFGAAYHTLFSEPLRRGEEVLHFPKHPLRLVIYPSSGESGPIPKVRIYTRREEKPEGFDGQTSKPVPDVGPTEHASYGLAFGTPIEDAKWRAEWFAVFAPRSRAKDPRIAALTLHHRIGLPEDATAQLLALEPAVANELVKRLPGSYLADVLRIGHALASTFPAEAERWGNPLQLAADPDRLLALIERAREPMFRNSHVSLRLPEDAQQLADHLRAIAARLR